MKIVISYARKQSKTMMAFRRAFQSEGVEVWTDRNIPRGSSNWQKEVQAAIDSCDGHCVLLSPTSRDSTWVLNEIGYSMLKRMRIFPVRIYGSAAEAVPLVLSTYQIDSISGFEGDARLRKIKRVVRGIVASLKKSK